MTKNSNFSSSMMYDEMTMIHVFEKTGQGKLLKWHFVYRTRNKSSGFRTLSNTTHWDD